MTDETFNIDALTEDENRLVTKLAAQLKQRSRRNQKRSDLYDGKNAIQQVGSVIPPQYYNIGLALGWSAKGVDGLARRCKLDRMVWTGGDLDSLGMQELADSNFLFSEIAQGQTDSLIHGVSFLITTKGEGDEPAALVHARDALNATGEWNYRTRRMDNLLSVTSREDNRITGFVLYLFNETISAELERGVWTVERSTHSWGVPVDALIYRPRSSKRMGRSRITRAAMSHQAAALRGLVRLEGHMDIYSIPQLILLGASDRVFRNADGSQKASWQVALGRVFGVPDDEDATNPRADVKQFSAESPAPHLAHINALAKLEAREFDLPDADFALTDMANPTSADSYSEATESLIAEAEDTTDFWSVGIRSTVRRALAIQNGVTDIPTDWASIDTKFRAPRFLSRSAEADAGQKQIAAIPRLGDTEVGLELLGLTEQQIQRVQAEWARSNGRSVAMAAIAARRGLADGDSAAVES